MVSKVNPTKLVKLLVNHVIEISQNFRKSTSKKISKIEILDAANRLFRSNRTCENRKFPFGKKVRLISIKIIEISRCNRIFPRV